MATTVTYKGETLTTATNQTKTLLTQGKYMEDDVTITDTSPTFTTQTKSRTFSALPGGTQTSTIRPDAGYDGLTQVDVTINAIPTAGKQTVTVNAPSPTLSFDSATGVVTGTTVTQTVDRYPITSDGYIKTNSTVRIKDNGGASDTYQVPTQAAQTITPSSVQQTIAAGVYLTGTQTIDAIPSDYVGSGVARNDSTDLTASGATVTAPAGYYANSASKTVASGSATPPTTISGSQATLTTGTNTITLQKTLSVTPQVSAGYVSAGTAGNVLVNLNANVTTKAATTYHPSSSQQTIASDTYLTGTQTINAVTTTNLTAANIKSGVVVQVGDSSDPDCVTSVTGTYSGGGGTLTVATKTATMSAVGQTLSFTNLSGTPKYWFVKTTSQISSSGSTTIYYITDGFWDGTSVKGNSFRIGSTRRIYSWTSGVTQSYSGGTLTITGGSATGSSPGQFYNGVYELTYVY